MRPDPVYVVDIYHWADQDGVIHQITKPGEGSAFDVKLVKQVFSRDYIDTTTGEARTRCGLRLGHFKYYFTLEPPSCLACIAGDHLGWRSINSNGPK